LYLYYLLDIAQEQGVTWY